MSHRGPMASRLSSRGDSKVLITSEAPNDHMSILSPWIHYDGPYGPYMWRTTLTLGRFNTIPIGSSIMLFGRLVTSHITRHEYVSTPSVVSCWLEHLENCHGMFSIKDYSVVAWVYICEIYVWGSLIVWLCCVFGANTQPKFGWDPEFVVFDSLNHTPLDGLTASHSLRHLPVD